MKSEMLKNSQNRSERYEQPSVKDLKNNPKCECKRTEEPQKPLAQGEKSDQEFQFDPHKYVERNSGNTLINPFEFVEEEKDTVQIVPSCNTSVAEGSEIDTGNSRTEAKEKDLPFSFINYDEKGNIIIPDVSDARTIMRSINEGRKKEGLPIYPMFTDAGPNRIQPPEGWGISSIRSDGETSQEGSGLNTANSRGETNADMKCIAGEDTKKEMLNSADSKCYCVPIRKQPDKADNKPAEKSIVQQSQSINPNNIILKQQPKELISERGTVLLETPAVGVFNQTETSLERICNCIVKILCEKNVIAEFYDANGEKTNEDTEIFYKIQITSPVGNWSQELSFDEIIKPGWVHSTTRGRCFVEDGKRKHFVDYIRYKIALGDYEKIRQYKTGGWKKIGNRFLYAVADGCIGDSTCLFKGPDDMRLTYDSSGMDRKAIFDLAFNMKNVIKRPENGIVLFYFVLISLLTTLFKEANFQVKFILSLIGKTNSRKTSCGLLFSRIFNRKQVESPDINFRSTYGAIEESMEKYADACLLVDDFAPQDSRSSEMEQNKKLELIVRSFGDRTARKRMSGYIPAGAKPYHVVSGCCMITGEIDAGVLSSRSRTVRLDFEKDGTDNELLSYYQENLKIWPTFLVDFLEYVSENSIYIIQYIRDNARQFRRMNQDIFSIPRYAESFAVFLCMLNIFYDYVANRGYMDRQSCQNNLIAEADAIKRVLLKNDADIKLSNPAVMFVEGMHRSILDGTLSIVSSQIAFNDKEIIDDSKVIIENDDHYCIRLNIAIDHVIRYWKKYGVDFQFRSQRTLIPFLVEEELILTKEDPSGKKRNTHKLSGCKFTEERFLFIKKQKFHETINQNN